VPEQEAAVIFAVVGAGKHTYRFVFTDGSTKQGREVMLTKAPDAADGLELLEPLQEHGSVGRNRLRRRLRDHLVTYHDRCQRP
jgi:hypothetical protein